MVIAGAAAADIASGSEIRPTDLAWGFSWLFLPAVGALIASRRPENPVGWLASAFGLPLAVALLGDEYSRYAIVVRGGALPGGVFAHWLSQWPFFFAGTIAVFILLLFPDGRLPSRRWRAVAWVTMAATALAVVGAIFGPTPNDDVPVGNPIGIKGLEILFERFQQIGGTAFAVLIPLAIFSTFLRLRRAGREERQQLKWFFYGLALTVLIILTLFLAEEIFGVQSDAVVVPPFVIAMLAPPAGLAIGILRYRLYDIDVVINKTLVFAALAAFITAAYLGIVIGIGALVGSRGNLALSVLATALIAVAFQPVRERARHLANRLVYGKRATPYEVLSEFSQRMGGGYSTEEILPQLTRILAEGTGAARADVWLRVGSELHSVAVWPAQPAASSVGLAVTAEELPDIPEADAAFAVRHQGELLGAVSLRMPPGESLTPAGEKLASDLASQAALVLRNVRLLAELRASRQRIVAAQDEERRRLERDIHDAAQQQLVALAVKAGLARNLLDRDTQKTARILDEIKIETHEIVETVRELARGVFPPALAEKGIVSALRSHVTKMGLDAKFLSDSIGDARFHPQTEAAIYFCIREALQNASKHAAGTPITISFAFKDGSLEFSVRDQGRGFDPETVKAGSGLQNMVDRIEAIGGALSFDSAPGRGTTVKGRVPIRMKEPVS